MGGAIACSAILFIVEILLGLPVLTLSPVLALVSDCVFLSKAGTLSGMFYFQAAALFLVSALMALFPAFGLTLFGVASGVAFFVPGLKYYRQRRARNGAKGVRRRHA